jgi:hypothetical protein
MYFINQEKRQLVSLFGLESTYCFTLCLSSIKSAKGLIMTNASGNTTKPSTDLFTAPRAGAEPYGADVIQKFENAAALRGADYQPRTRHLRPDGWARYTNRLFLLRYYRKTRDPDILEMIENSLFHMAGGGIYDHVAEGLLF